MKKSYKLIRGTFCEGNGVCIKEVNTSEYFHAIVFEEKGTNRLFVELGSFTKQITVYEEDIEITKQN